MTTIEIFYWRGKIESVGYEDRQQFICEEKDVTKTIAEIVTNVYLSGANSQVYNQKNGHTTIFIDSGRFRQS